MHVTTPLTDEMEQYLNLSTRRMQLLSSNMANVDTPGYKTQDINFAAEFARASSEMLLDRESGTGSAAHVALPQQVDGLLERPDGNNVSLERESMALSELQLQFRTATTLMKSEFTRISEAIREDK